MHAAAALWGLLARTSSFLHTPHTPLQAPGFLASDCTWRTCFTKDSHLCPICREGPTEEPAPPVAADWVPDATRLRWMFLRGKDELGNPFPPPLDKNLCQEIGPNGEWFDMNKKAFDASKITATLPRTPNLGPKVMCLAYTTSDQHATGIRAIRETWAGGCDGFVTFSNESDPRIPAVKLVMNGKEAYHNVWQKVRSMWRYTAKHYLDQFDFFMIATRDTYIMPENLRKYLRTVGDGTKEALFLGRRFKDPSNPVAFNSGGAGYVLSRKALKIFADHLDDKRCHPTDHVAAEDLEIAMCLKKVANVEAGDTRDATGHERFHPFQPDHMYTWGRTGLYDWYDEFNKERGLKTGKECCSPESVSYHYVSRPAMVRHLHALLYHCPAPR